MKAYQLKIMIKDSKPPIWRRIVVPAGLTFSQLQLIINRSFSWSGYHLGSFEFPRLGIRIEEPMEDFDDFAHFGWGRTYEDARETFIDEFFDFTDKCTYVYDFGDWWEHKITVEKILEDYPHKYPAALKVKGPNLPEDCGGIWGYYDIQERLEDENDPEYEELTEWFSYAQPSQYDLEELNILLEDLFLSGAVKPRMPEKMRNEADIEDWKKLYEAAGRVKSLALWEEFCDMDIIGIRKGAPEDTVFISIMGKKGSCYGLCFYEGYNQLRTALMTMGAAELNLPPELIYYKQSSITCFWGDREELSDIQYKRIKDMGLKFRGKNQWLYFMSFEEGYAPRELDADEVRRVTGYLTVLEQLLLNHKGKLMEVDFENGNYACADVRPPKALSVQETEIPEELYALPYLTIGDKVLIGRLKKQKHTQMRLEAEIIVVPGAEYKSEDGTRDVIPAVCVIADRSSGVIIANDAVEECEDPFINLADIVTQYIVKMGAPAEIYVSNKLVAACLDFLCKTAGIKLTIEKKLRQIPEFAKGIKEFLAEEDIDDDDDDDWEIW